jgi:hypothetical protein
MREGLNRSADTVAAQLGWSPSKISRYERAKTGLKPREVERLLDYYRVTGERRARLLALAMDAEQPGWWEEDSLDLPAHYQEYIGLEHEATVISIWQGLVVPGLLQTDAYARHVIRSYDQLEPLTPGAAARLLQARMTRQQVLRRDGLRVTVVLDESVLFRKVGTPAVMHEQLARLAMPPARPDVTQVRVLPLNARHLVFCESFTIFGYGPEGDALFPDVVAYELLNNSLTRHGENDADRYRRAFGVLSDAALSTAASRDRIVSAASRLWAPANGAA